MKLERKKATGKPQANYPTHEQARSDRRGFLRLLGCGLLAAPLLGVAGCEFGGKKKVPADAGADALLEPDYTMGGVAPDGIGVEPDNGPDWNLSGGAPMDPDLRTRPEEVGPLPGEDIPEPKPEIDVTQEDVPPLAGDMPAPEPEIDVTQEDVPPLAGDITAPDVGTRTQGDVKGEVDAEVDVEEPPLDGDMPAPGF